MMTVHFSYLVFLLSSVIKVSHSQFSHSKNTVTKSACDDANKTSMVERFFNVIFTEFQQDPPVCVCVQMCADQPTYCYPTGCLKKADSKKKNNQSPVTHIQTDDASKTMFLVDEKNNYAQLLNARAEETQKSTTSSDFFSDPLKDMYKTFFKYKRMPKVELRYNLREQVKNMKSDILKLETDDVSKTRWPKLQPRIIHDQKIYNEKLNQRRNLETGKTKFFLSAPERGRNSYNSKYFKRDLRKNDQHDLYSLYDKPDTAEKDFSIETLIENLIGNSFTNETKLDGNDTVSEIDGNFRRQVLNRTKIDNNHNTNNTIDDMCIVTRNATNDNEDEYKYIEEGLVEEVVKKWSNYTFEEMISELSKRIDVYNKTSLEMMKNISGDNQNPTTSKPLKDSADAAITDVVVNVEIVEHKAMNSSDVTKVPPFNSTHTVTTEVTSRNEVIIK